MVVVQNKYKTLRYTPYSGDKALTDVIWVLRKPTRVFVLLSLSHEFGPPRREYIAILGEVQRWDSSV